MKQFALMLALVLGLALATQSVTFAQEEGGSEGEQSEGSGEESGGGE